MKPPPSLLCRKPCASLRLLYLKVYLRSELEVPRLQDQRRALPPVGRRVVAEPRRDGLPVVRVEHVVDVHGQPHATLAVGEELLADAHVELLAVPAAQRERL